MLASSTEQMTKIEMWWCKSFQYDTIYDRWSSWLFFIPI